MFGLFQTTKKDIGEKRRYAEVLAFVENNRFSTIPSMLSKIVQISSDPDSTLEDFVNVCSLDQSASIRVLRASNSVAFAPSTGAAVRTIKDAIVRLGRLRTCQILSGSVVSPLFKNGAPIGSYSPGSLWLNSVAVAAGNRIIYDLLKLPEPADADPYLVGLLHNMGIPLEHQCFLDQGFRDAVLAREQHESVLADEEHAALGITHAELGGFLTQEWKMPSSISLAIRYHHEPNQDAAVPVRQMIHVTRASQWICQELKLGYAEFSENQSTSYLASFEELGIQADQYTQIVGRLERELARWTQLGWFKGLSLASR
jgi:HD-like signal output (HDOD) protein